MSAPLSTQIADEVVGILNAATTGTFSPALTIARRHAPYFELAKLTGVQASVVPTSKEQTFSSRKFIDADHEIKIYLQAKLAKPEDPAELDPLTNLADVIGEYLAADDGSGHTRRLLPTTHASLMKMSGPILFTKELVDDQQFITCLTLTYSTQVAFR